MPEIDLNLVNLLVVGLVPAAVALTKKVVARLPKWVIPIILVPAFGAVLQAITSAAAAGVEPNPVVGAVLGGLGLWLREMVDHLKQLAGGAG